jgi:peptidoglycan/xylan/chitin deacetylase (PgdA/CDA1 family)
MWDLVTRDYNPKLTGEQVLAKVKKYVRPGSIITFHDSLRSVHNLHYALPRAIEWLQAEGYEFRVIE